MKHTKIKSLIAVLKVSPASDLCIRAEFECCEAVGGCPDCPFESDGAMSQLIKELEELTK